MHTLAHEEAYRGKGILSKMATQAITVCGCGAVGSNFIDNAVRQGFKDIQVIDMDRVEDHNRHTQIWDKRVIGSLKAVAIKNHAFNMGVLIGAISKKLEEDNVKKLLLKGSIVIDGFDNSESRKLVTNFCRDNKIDCLHVGLYQDYAEIVWNEFYTPPEPSTGPDVCEYPLARNVILMAVAVATDVLIRYLDTGVKENYTITLKDFKISPKER